MSDFSGKPKSGASGGKAGSGSAGTSVKVTKGLESRVKKTRLRGGLEQNKGDQTGGPRLNKPSDLQPLMANQGQPRVQQPAIYELRGQDAAGGEDRFRSSADKARGRVLVHLDANGELQVYEAGANYGSDSGIKVYETQGQKSLLSNTIEGDTNYRTETQNSNADGIDTEIDRLNLTVRFLRDVAKQPGKFPPEVVSSLVNGGIARAIQRIEDLTTQIESAEPPRDQLDALAAQEEYTARKTQLDKLLMAFTEGQTAGDAIASWRQKLEVGTSQTAGQVASSPQMRPAPKPGRKVGTVDWTGGQPDPPEGTPVGTGFGQTGQLGPTPPQNKPRPTEKAKGLDPQESVFTEPKPEVQSSGARTRIRVDMVDEKDAQGRRTGKFKYDITNLDQPVEGESFVLVEDAELRDDGTIVRSTVDDDVESATRAMTFDEARRVYDQGNGDFYFAETSVADSEGKTRAYPILTFRSTYSVDGGFQTRDSAVRANVWMPKDSKPITSVDGERLAGEPIQLNPEVQADLKPLIQLGNEFYFVITDPETGIVEKLQNVSPSELEQYRGVYQRSAVSDESTADAAEQYYRNENSEFVHRQPDAAFGTTPLSEDQFASVFERGLDYLKGDPSPRVNDSGVMIPEITDLYQEIDALGDYPELAPKELSSVAVPLATTDNSRFNLIFAVRQLKELKAVRDTIRAQEAMGEPVDPAAKAENKDSIAELEAFIQKQYDDNPGISGDNGSFAFGGIESLNPSSPFISDSAVQGMPMPAMIRTLLGVENDIPPSEITQAEYSNLIQQLGQIARGEKTIQLGRQNGPQLGMQTPEKSAIEANMALDWLVKALGPDAFDNSTARQESAQAQLQFLRRAVSIGQRFVDQGIVPPETLRKYQDTLARLEKESGIQATARFDSTGLQEGFEYPFPQGIGAFIDRGITQDPNLVSALARRFFPELDEAEGRKKVLQNFDRLIELDEQYSSSPTGRSGRGRVEPIVDTGPQTIQRPDFMIPKALQNAINVFRRFMPKDSVSQMFRGADRRDSSSVRAMQGTDTRTRDQIQELEDILTLTESPEAAMELRDSGEQLTGFENDAVNLTIQASESRAPDSIAALAQFRKKIRTLAEQLTREADPSFDAMGRQKQVDPLSKPGQSTVIGEGEVTRRSTAASDFAQEAEIETKSGAPVQKLGKATEGVEPPEPTSFAGQNPFFNINDPEGGRFYAGLRALMQDPEAKAAIDAVGGLGAFLRQVVLLRRDQRAALRLYNDLGFSPEFQQRQADLLTARQIIEQAGEDVDMADAAIEIEGSPGIFKRIAIRLGLSPDMQQLRRDNLETWRGILADEEARIDEETANIALDTLGDIDKRLADYVENISPEANATIEEIVVRSRPATVVPGSDLEQSASTRADADQIFNEDGTTSEIDVEAENRRVNSNREFDLTPLRGTGEEFSNAVNVFRANWQRVRQDLESGQLTREQFDRQFNALKQSIQGFANDGGDANAQIEPPAAAATQWLNVLNNMADERFGVREQADIVESPSTERVVQRKLGEMADDVYQETLEEGEVPLEGKRGQTVIEAKPESAPLQQTRSDLSSLKTPPPWIDSAVEVGDWDEFFTVNGDNKTESDALRSLASGKMYSNQFGGDTSRLTGTMDELSAEANKIAAQLRQEFQFFVNEEGPKGASRKMAGLMRGEGTGVADLQKPFAGQKHARAVRFENLYNQWTQVTRDLASLERGFDPNPSSIPTHRLLQNPETGEMVMVIESKVFPIDPKMANNPVPNGITQRVYVPGNTDVTKLLKSTDTAMSADSPLGAPRGPAENAAANTETMKKIDKITNLGERGFEVLPLYSGETTDVDVPLGKFTKVAYPTEAPRTPATKRRVKKNAALKSVHDLEDQRAELEGRAANVDPDQLDAFENDIVFDENNAGEKGATVKEDPKGQIDGDEDVEVEGDGVKTETETTENTSTKADVQPNRGKLIRNLLLLTGGGAAAWALSQANKGQNKQEKDINTPAPRTPVDRIREKTQAQPAPVQPAVGSPVRQETREAVRRYLEEQRRAGTGL